MIRENSSAIHVGYAGGPGVYIDNNVVPNADNTYTMGGEYPFRWSYLYAVNTTIQTSDLRDKTSIRGELLGLDFINRLRPVSYEWKSKPNGIHHGMIAQDVEKALTSLGVESFYGLQKPETADGHYGLGYDEFIGPTIKAVQELSSANDNLKTELQSMKAQIEELRHAIK